MAIFQTVEIPGLREAIRRERTQRDLAFIGGNEIVFGIVVRQLSLRTALYLEHAGNGFMIPVIWDFDGEDVAHAIQVLWFSRIGWEAPDVQPRSIWKQFVDARRVALFQRKVLKNGTADALVKEVKDWLDESTFDSPAGSTSELPRQSYVSHPAHLVDLFGAAGLPFTYDQIMDMPLKRLWQHYKLAAYRLYDVKLTNPSDEITASHLSKGAA